MGFVFIIDVDFCLSLLNYKCSCLSRWYGISDRFASFKNHLVKVIHVSSFKVIPRFLCRSMSSMCRFTCRLKPRFLLILCISCHWQNHNRKIGELLMTGRSSLSAGKCLMDGMIRVYIMLRHHRREYLRVTTIKFAD